MKTLNCLLVDDSIEIIDSISDILGKYSFLKITSKDNLHAAQQHLLKEKFDIIFLDIRLGNDSGLELIKTLDSPPPVIIISGYAEYAVETYGLNSVIDYILKPINETRLLKAIGRVMALNNSSTVDETKGYLFLKVARKATRFDFDSIDYIESIGINCKVYYDGNYQLASESISDIEKFLPASFKRVHKSYIVNLNKITSLSLKTIEVNNSKVPIGVSFRPKLVSLLKLFNVH